MHAAIELLMNQKPELRQYPAEVKPFKNRDKVHPGTCYITLPSEFTPKTDSTEEPRTDLMSKWLDAFRDLIENDPKKEDWEVG